MTIPERWSLLKKNPILLSAISAVVVVALVAFFVLRGDPEPQYQTAQVVRGDIQLIISSAGKVRPKDSVDVGAQVSGQLENLLVEVGDVVQKGQLLAEIDHTLASAQVDSSRAQLKEIEASTRQQNATLELAQAKEARAKILRKADAISVAEYEQERAGLKVAEAQLQQMAAQKERLQSTLEANLATLEYTKIYAPITGTIISQSVVEGQTLNANQVTPTILTIADLNLMMIEAEVSEADVQRIKPEQPAYFTTLGAPEFKWETKVRKVLPQPEVLNDVVLYKALLDVQNKDDQLKPEMTAQVFFVTAEAQDVLLIPTVALRNAPAHTDNPARDRGESSEDWRGVGGLLPAARAANADGPLPGTREFHKAREAYPEATQKMVLKLVEGTPHPQPVLVGLQSRTQAEIVWGLEEGDVVVTYDVAGAASPNRSANGDRPPGPPSGAFGRRMR